MARALLLFLLLSALPILVHCACGVTGWGDSFGTATVYNNGPDAPPTLSIPSPHTGDYTINTDCYIRINPTPSWESGGMASGDKITLYFTHFNLENNFDFVRVYDASDTTTAILELTGVDRDRSYHVLDSTDVYLYFESDYSQVRTGFVFTWWYGKRYSVTIPSGNDDAYQEQNDGSPTVTTNDLRPCDGGDDAGSNVLLRFLVALPQDSIIWSAFLVGRSKEGETDQFVVNIFAHDVNNCNDAGSDFKYNARSATTASASWDFNFDWDANEYHPSPLVTDVVDEVMSRNGWRKDRPICFIMEPAGQPAFCNDNRKFDSFEDGNPFSLSIMWNQGATELNFVDTINTLTGGVTSSRIRVEIRDDEGDVVTDDGPDEILSITLTCTFTLSTGTTSRTVVAVNGIADFYITPQESGLVYSTDRECVATATSYKGNNLSQTSNQFTIQDRINNIIVVQDASDGQVLSDLPTQPHVRLRDIDNNRIQDGQYSTSTVTISILSGSGSLGSESMSAVGGNAVFSGFQIQNAGSSFVAGDFDLRATCEGFTADFSTITVVDVATTVGFTTSPPASTLADVTFPVQVTIYGVNGALVAIGSDSGLTVDLTLQAGSGELTAGPLSVAATGGVSDFATVSVGGTGFASGTGFQIRAAIASPAVQGDSTTFTVFEPAATIAFVTAPAAGADYFAGDVLPLPSVEILGTYDTSRVLTGPDSSLTVVLSLSGSESVTGSTSENAASGITPTYTGLTVVASGFSAPGAFTLTASVAARPALTVTTASFNVFRRVTAFTFANLPSPIGATDVFEDEVITGLSVQGVDTDGTPVALGPHATASVALSLSAGAGTLAGGGAVAASAGVATFSSASLGGATLTPGINFELDATGAGATSTSSTFAIYAIATAVQVVDEPAAPASGTSVEVLSGNPEFEVVDSRGNRVIVGPHSTVVLRMASTTANMKDSTFGVVDGGLEVTLANGATPALSDVFLGHPGFVCCDHVITASIPSIPAVSTADTASMTIHQGANGIAWVQVPTSPLGTESAGDALSPVPVMDIVDAENAVVSSGPDAGLTITLTVDGTSSGVGDVRAAVETASATSGQATFPPFELISNGNFGPGQFFVRATATNAAGSTINGVSSPSFELIDSIQSLVFSVQPDHTGVANDPLTTQPVVQGLSSNGFVVAAGPDSTAEISLAAIGGGDGDLQGTLTVNLVNGEFTFTDVLVAQMSGDVFPTTFRLRAFLTADVLNFVNSNTFTVEPAAVTMSLAPGVGGQQPDGDVLAGDQLSVYPRVVLRDIDSNPITSGPHATGQVTVFSNSGTFVGTSPVAAVNGVVTFPDGAVDYPGLTFPSNLRFTFAGIARTSNTFVIFPRADHIVVQTEPVADVLQGVNFPTRPIVAIFDEENNQCSSGPHATLSVQVNLASGPGGTLSAAPDTVVCTGGSCSFTGSTISIGGGGFAPGMHTLGFVVTTLPAVTGTAVPVAVYAVPDDLQVTVAPSGPYYGGQTISASFSLIYTPSSAVVTVGPDASAVVQVTLSGGTASIGGPSSAAAASGVRAFSEVIDLTGLTPGATFQLDATTVAAPILTVSSTTFTIFDKASVLVFVAQPVGDRMGVDLLTPPAIEVHDVDDTLIVLGDDAVLTVDLSLTGTGALGGTLSASLVAGEITWTALQVQDPAFLPSTAFTLVASALGGTVTGTSAAFSVGGVATQLSFFTEPIANVLNGATFSTPPVVHILDRDNNLIEYGAHASLDVSLAQSGGVGGVTGTASVTAAGGVAAFPLVAIDGGGFEPSNLFAFVATTVAPSLSMTSTTFDVYGVPSSIVVTTDPGPGPFLGGDDIAPGAVFELRHSTGGLIARGPHSTEVVTVTLTGAGSLASAIAIACTGGVLDLSASPPVAAESGLTPGGGFVLTATTTTPALTIDTSAFTLHDRASYLEFTTQPVGALSDASLGTAPVVEVKDVNGDTILIGTHASIDISIYLGATAPAAAISGSGTLAATSGSATWPAIVIGFPGFVPSMTYTLSTDSPTLPALAVVTSDPFEMAAVATQIVFAQQPLGGVFDGVVMPVAPVVHILDQDNAIVGFGPHHDLTVTLALIAGEDSLDSGFSATASAGIATFASLVVSTTDFVPSNLFQVEATTAAPALSVNSATFEMFARATELRFTISPTGRYLTQDVLPDPQVELVHDDSNSRVSAGLHASTTVKIELLNNLALATTTVSTAAFEGLADGFPALVMDPTTLPAGDSGELFFLRATILSDSIVVDSTTFRVDATATQLVFSTEPVGNMFPTELLTTMPVVEVLDVNGNRVDTGLHSSLDVTLSLGAGPDNADLVGTATASLVGGIATWADISVDNTTYPVNRTFVLTATETTIPLTVDSATFDVFLAFIVGPLPEFQAYTETTVAGTLSYELILEPTTDVLLRLSGTDDMLIIDGVSSTTASGVEAVLTFTPLDWSDAQTIDIFAIDNDIDEVNNTRHVVVTSTINSTDSRFDVWTIPPTTVDVIDDDMVGYVGPSVVNHTIADEDGGRSTFNLRLTSEPLFAVTIESAAASSLVPRLAEVRHAGDDRIVFTPSNWDTTAVVTVEAVDNDLPKGTQDFIVPWSVESDDPSYHELELDEIRVVIEDDDQANIPTVSLAEEKIVIYTNTGSENLFYRDFFFVNSTFFEIEEVICTYSSIHDDKFEVDQGPSIAYRTSHSPHYGNLTFLATEEKGAVTVSVTAKYAGGVMTTAPVKFTISVEATPTPLISRIVPNNGPAQGGTPAVITGNYFGETPENLTVTIADGVPCAGGAEWVSITKVICTTSPAPMQNSSGPIYVETALGRKESTTVIYTYNPDPVINSVSQWSMDVGILSPVLVAGLNFGFSSSDVTSVTFAGVPCTDLVYLNTSALLCTPGTVDAPTSGPVRIETTSHGFVETTRSFSYIMPVVEQVIYHRSPADKPWVLTVVGHDFGPSPVTNVTIDNVDCLTFVELPPNVDNKDVIECRMPIGWENDPTFPCVDVVSETGGKGICDADVVHEFPLPVVTSIVPNRMSVTDSGLLDITLHGHDFGLTAESFVNTSMVSTQSKTSPMFCFGGLAVWISPEEIRCRLPDTGYNVWSETDKVFIGATVGIETLNGVGPRDKRFTFEPARYPPPVISDITPKVGSAVPLDVTLTGEFFGLLGNDSITIEFQGPFGFAKCLEPTWKSPERVTCKSPRFFDFNMTVDDNKDRTYPFRITVGDETSAIVDRGFEYQLQLNTPVLLSVAPTILPLEGGLGWIFAHQIDIQVFGYVGDFEQFATESSTQPIEFVTNICLSEDLCVVEEEEEAGRLRQMFNDTVDPGSAGGTNGTSGGDVDVPDVLVPEEPIEEEAEEVYTVVVERGGCAADNATCLFEANGFPISTELRASLVKECEGLILCRAILVKFPPQPEEGLYSITLERIDREEAGFDTIENVLFYTGGCAEDGKWGPSRTDCRDCPKGGICTGGSSVAAAPGYWTPNPGSDYVVECYPQERCLGGANGDCAEGYDGEVCGRCADGYYLYAQVCKDCPPKLTVLIFLVVAATVWTFFCFVVYYVKKRTTLSFLVSFLMGVQILAAIGDMTPNKAPTWIQVPAWFLKLFMADFSFIVFDCWRYVPFWVYYLLGLAYSLAVIVLMYIVGKVFQGMRLSYYRNHGTKATYEERALYYRDRLTRAFSIGFQVIYLTLVTRGLEVLSCTQRVDGQWRLVVRQDVLCYEGDHWISGGVAIGILALIGLGYPLGYLWFMLKYRHKETDPVTGIVSGGLWRNESFMERYNFGYSLFKREHEGFFFMEIAVLIGLAGAKAHLATHPRYQMGVPVLFFLMKLCLVIFYRPYEHVKFNLIQMLICLGAMTALCANWFYNVEWMNNTVPSLMAFAVAALFGLAYVWLIFNIGVAMVAPPEEVGGTYLEDDISDEDFFTEIKEEMPTVIGASEVFQYGMMKSIDEQEALAGDSIYVLGPDGLPIEDEEGDYVLTRKEIARRRLDETYEPTLLEWVDMKFFDDDDYADEIAEILAEREKAMSSSMAMASRPRRGSTAASLDNSFGISDSESNSDEDSLTRRDRVMSRSRSASGASRSSRSMSLDDANHSADGEQSSVPPIPVLESVSEEATSSPAAGKGKGKMFKGKGKMFKGKGKMFKGKGKGKLGKGKSSP